MLTQDGRPYRDSSALSSIARQVLIHEFAIVQEVLYLLSLNAVARRN